MEEAENCSCFCHLLKQTQPLDCGMDLSETEKGILAGKLDNLPKIRSKIVRIFTSSTFTDTSAERNALMSEVYPALKEVCREKYGLDFQVVDMRWGVRTEASDDHSTADLCFKEIQNCQNLSMGPNFVVFIGQKYGFRPIPASVGSEEFELMRDTLMEKNFSVRELDVWYKKDVNSVPPKYILQPISTMLPNFTNYNEPELQSENGRRWWKIFERLQKLLRTAALALFSDAKFAQAQMHTYFASITEQEVVRGILAMDESQAKTLCYLRKIENIDFENLQQASKFIDISWPTGKLDRDAGEFLEDLKEVVICKKLADDNIARYTVDWEEPDGISEQTHREYLNHFTAHFYGKMLQLIDKAVVLNDESTEKNPVVAEVAHHLKMLKTSFSNDYVSENDDALKVCRRYVIGTDKKPLVFYGPDGCGKTKFVSKCYSKTFEWMEKVNASPLTIIRFLGTTPQSSTITGLLRSLCRQIAFIYGSEPVGGADDIANLMTRFQNVLALGSRERPLVIFLVSLNLLKLDGSGRNKFSWIPPVLPEYCKVIGTCLESEPDSISSDIHLLRDIVNDESSIISLGSICENNDIEILKTLLDSSKRKITEHQWSVVRNAVKKCSTPLYLKIVFDEICSWKSYTTLMETQLPLTLEDSIQQLLDKIEFKHGKAFVSHALGYITAASGGLSEAELEDLLSLDDIVLNDVYEWHLPPVRRIPPLLWTRLRNDLPGYFADRELDDSSVMNWLHSPLRDAITARYFKNEAFKLQIHSNSADYFLGVWGGGREKAFSLTSQQMKRLKINTEGAGAPLRADRKVPLQPLLYYDRDGNVARYNRRKLRELPHHLMRSGKVGELCRQVLFNYSWIYAKINATSIKSVLWDLDEARAGADESTKIEISLVADCIRLGGHLIKTCTEMIAPQLIGRLLPFATNDYPNITQLVQQCQTGAKCHNALLPLNHCLHSPGGPLKFALKHCLDFCIFPDSRSIVCLTQKSLITYDIYTSEKCSEISFESVFYPRGLAVSSNGNFAAVVANVNGIVMFDLLSNRAIPVQVSLGHQEVIRRLSLGKDHAFIYGNRSWRIYSMKRGDLTKPVSLTKTLEGEIEFANICDSKNYIIGIYKPGINKRLVLAVTDGLMISLLEYYYHVAFIEGNRIITWLSEEKKEVTVLELSRANWSKLCVHLLEDLGEIFSVSVTNAKKNCAVVCSELGFQILDFKTGSTNQLLLPSTNYQAHTSLHCCLIMDGSLALSTAGNAMHVWDLKTWTLVRKLETSFSGEIVKLATTKNDNGELAVTLSKTDTIKGWKLESILESCIHVEELGCPIQSISVSNESNQGVTLGRDCFGIWDICSGKLKQRIVKGLIWNAKEAIISASGNYCACLFSDKLIVWETQSGTVMLERQHGGAMEKIFRIHSKDALATVCSDPGKNKSVLVSIVDLPSGNQLTQYSIKGKRNAQGELMLTTTWKYLIAARTEKTGIFFDLLPLNGFEDEIAVRSVALERSNYGMLRSITSLADDDSLMVLTEVKGSRIVSLVTGKTLHKLPGWQGICNANGKLALIVIKGAGYCIFDTWKNQAGVSVTSKLVKRNESPKVEFTRNGEHILEYERGSKVLNLYRSSDGNLISNYIMDENITEVNADLPQKLLVGSTSGSLTILNIVDLYAKGEKQSACTIFRPMIQIAASKMMKLASRAQISTMNKRKKQLEAQGAEIFNKSSSGNTSAIYDFTSSKNVQVSCSK